MISIRRSPTSHPAEKQNAKREASALTDNRCFRPRACLKKAFRELRVPVCGRFYPNKGGVAGYVNRMRVKSPTKWGSQIAEMIFQTRSSFYFLYLQILWLPDHSMLLHRTHCSYNNIFCLHL